MNCVRPLSPSWMSSVSLSPCLLSKVRTIDLRITHLWGDSAWSHTPAGSVLSARHCLATAWLVAWMVNFSFSTYITMSSHSRTLARSFNGNEISSHLPWIMSRYCVWQQNHNEFKFYVETHCQNDYMFEAVVEDVYFGLWKIVQSR